VRWLFPFVVLVLSAGFAKICVASANWCFAHRLPKPIIVATHTLNVSLILGYPLFLCVSPDSSNLRLLLAGHVDQVPFSGWLPLADGAVGLCLLIWSTIEFQLYAPPACQTGCELRRVDLRRETGPSWHTTFVGSGPMRRIALLPGNEQFTIDVSTKTYSLPRLPAEWNGLSLVQLSDLHFRGAVTRAYFEAVCEQAAALKPDLFVFTGDLLDDPKLIEWLSATLGKLTAPQGQYFILGNHDWYLDSAAIRHELERLGWTDLAGHCVSLRKHDAAPVVLCGDETPWMGTHPDLSSVSAEAFRILLSHTPDNITWARSQGFDVMLSGHTHGGQIRLPILGPVYSPSRFGCRFSGGVFWLEPTLLHVSRGLSGREPIRYNCPPELTKLVLRCGSQAT
jgi:predicted MPP superfamily phosphohydrolase